MMLPIRKHRANPDIIGNFQENFVDSQGTVSLENLYVYGILTM